MKLYSVETMREAERRSESEYGIPLSALMDNAGRGLALAALDLLQNQNGPVGIFCGNGNNGGDGYVCASILTEHKKDVLVWGIGLEKHPAGSLVKNAADAFRGAGGVIRSFSEETSANDIECSLIIDALLGTGLTRPVEGLYAHAIRLINEAPTPVLSCDLPSGVDADTGRIMGLAVRADKTLMMGLAKMACELPPGSEYFGDTEVCDIGLPRELIL